RLTPGSPPPRIGRAAPPLRVNRAQSVRPRFANTEAPITVLGEHQVTAVVLRGEARGVSRVAWGEMADAYRTFSARTSAARLVPRRPPCPSPPVGASRGAPPSAWVPQRWLSPPPSCPSALRPPPSPATRSR